MNIFQITSPATLRDGLLILNDDQARRRKHLLVKQSAKVKSFKLDADELAFITPKKGELAVYKLIGDTMFKAGERIGYDGELNKAMAALLKPVTEVEETAEDEAEDIDVALVNAIAELEPGNSAHFTTQGKPELKILAGLLKRKVTGKERDAAFAYFNEHGMIEATDEKNDTVAPDLLGALQQLSDSGIDDDYEDDGTPKLDIVSGLTGREVSADELEAALASIEVKQDAAD